MKKKKKIILIISVILILLGLILCFSLINFKDENSLTLEEDKWIEENKYNVIDISVLNDIPVLSYDGDGLVYDFLDYVTDNLSLKFNVVPQKLDTTSEYEYKMDIVDNPTNNDIVLLKDNMVLVTSGETEYSDINEISNLKLGIISSDKALLSDYFIDKGVEFVEYNTYSELKKSLTVQQSEVESQPVVQGIIISKTLFTKELIESNYKIAYQFNDLNKYFVLTFSNNVLNNILTKNYNTWKKENYSISYNENLLEDYFNFKSISDVQQKNLSSKSYIYGFIDYGIYNYLDGDKISGISGLILKGFNEFSGLSITYTKYNSINTLLQDFNNHEVDFMLNICDDTSYTNEIYKTSGVLNKKFAIISGISNTTVVNGLNSLKSKEVLTIKDSYIEKYLINNGIKVKSYNNLGDLTNDFKSSDITIIDLENYNFYKTSAFEDTKIDYLFDFNDKYNYVINNNSNNIVFEELFNFYTSYTSINELVTVNYSDIAYENINITYILIIIIVVLCIYLVLDFSNHVKIMIKNVKKNKKIHLSKEDKIKYIDQLTSLKNRAYLNSRIESWDDSEIYPQAIIIIDLNNVAYINDNYGREEGDKVITEAANILIQHQLQNSEIIRTDGNEFLIYLVGYSEKQIISYLRKLNKELKGLSHGFGAASGYSIITDAIKTVDDAVNEATLDMKNNKEDINY